MTPELLDIQPRELKFTFELKKQSSCSVQLSNYSDQYVAFKVKTTSPRKYCVRPNTGVVLPKSNLVFTVTMQSQREAPPDMQCRDKFLIQSTIVPFGTNAEDIKPTLFTKENGRYVEENKLRVVLISPPHSPVLLPINGVSKQEQTYETPILKQEPIMKDQASSDAENLPPSFVAQVSEDAHATKLEEEATKLVGEATELDGEATEPDADATKLDADANKLDADANKLDADGTKLDADVTRKVDDLKMKLDKLESQLNEAEKTILRLREERSTIVQAKDMLQQELASAKKQSAVQKVQVGFPFLFVCFIGLVSMVLGYMIRT